MTLARGVVLTAKEVAFEGRGPSEVELTEATVFPFVEDFVEVDGRLGGGGRSSSSTVLFEYFVLTVTVSVVVVVRVDEGRRGLGDEDAARAAEGRGIVGPKRRLILPGKSTMAR